MDPGLRCQGCQGFRVFGLEGLRVLDAWASKVVVGSRIFGDLELFNMGRTSSIPSPHGPCTVIL